MRCTALRGGAVTAVSYGVSERPEGIKYLHARSKLHEEERSRFACFLGRRRSRYPTFEIPFLGVVLVGWVSCSLVRKRFAAVAGAVVLGACWYWAQGAAAAARELGRIKLAAWSAGDCVMGRDVRFLHGLRRYGGLHRVGGLQVSMANAIRRPRARAGAGARGSVAALTVDAGARKNRTRARA
jgi:hypothetical protein